MTKKRKKQFNARLKEGTVRGIQRLSEVWEMSQGEVIEKVISHFMPEVESKTVFRAEPEVKELEIVPIEDI